MAGGRTKPTDRVTEKGMRTSQRAVEQSNIEINELKANKYLQNTRISAAETSITNLNTTKLEWTSVPPAVISKGTAGQIAYEAGYLYICVATNSWRRVAIATWS